MLEKKSRPAHPQELNVTGNTNAPGQAKSSTGIHRFQIAFDPRLYMLVLH
jgi:hypothetical protein